jgi:probable HAF family extracellular repeat protein
MVGIGDLPGGNFGSEAYDVSADGSVIVGRSRSDAGDEAFIWTESNGMVGLGYLNHPDGFDHNSRANAISADGSVVVGHSISTNGSDVGYIAFIWSDSTGIQSLGELTGGDYWSDGYDVSSDGSVVVGCSGSVYGAEAFIWDSENGMRSLKELLTNVYGVDLNGWTLTEANSITDDGETIVGVGVNPDGNQEAWLANISYVPAGDFNKDIDVDAPDLFHFVLAFSTQSFPDGDLDDDGSIDDGDVEKMAREFGHFFPNAYDPWDL